MKLNKKGFTLIELLAVIVIIGLVLGLSTYGIIKAVNNSKEKARDITKNNIIKAAETYSEEKEWIETSSPDEDYFCVSIEKLINKGLLKEEVLNDFSKDYFILITKNKKTKVITNKELIKDPKTEKQKSEKCAGILEYNITYYSDGKKLEGLEPSKYTYRKGATLPKNIIKEGHKFEGWYTNKELSGTPVIQINNDAETFGHKEYYAKWKQNTYTITYNENKGNSYSLPESQTKLHDVDLTITKTKPTRNSTSSYDYTFKNWNTKSDGKGKTYNSGSTYSANENVTLYAQWTSTSKQNCEYYYYSQIKGNNVNCRSNPGTINESKKTYNNGHLFNDNGGGYDKDGDYWVYNSDDNCYIYSKYVEPSNSISGNNGYCGYSGGGSSSTCSTYYVKTSSVLNCRTGAGTGNPVDKRYSNCTKITACSDPSGWYKTGDNCYVSSDYIDQSPCSSGGGSSSDSGSSCCKNCRPKKTEYYFYEKLDLTGMKIGCEDAYNEKFKNCFDPGLGTNFTKTGQNKISVDCYGESFSFDITVKDCSTLTNESTCKSHKYCVWNKTSAKCSNAQIK